MEKDIGMFEKLSVKEVEEMVGKSAVAVNVRGKWIECVFANPNPRGTDVNVLFKKW